MFIHVIKKSQDLNYSEMPEMLTILHEVKQHGFYSAYCHNVLPNTGSHDALISAIQHMAANASLRVTFNKEESICIFEAY